MVSYVWSNTKVILFHHWFGSLAVNAGAIIEISIISHQLSAVWFIWAKQVNKKLIPIYGLHISMYSIGVQYTILNINCYINIVINMGTTQLHVYRVWYVGSIPNCHFSLLALTLCVM